MFWSPSSSLIGDGFFMSFPTHTYFLNVSLSQFDFLSQKIFTAEGFSLLGSTVLCVLVNNWQFHLHARKLIWHWEIPIFDRKYIFTHGGFSSQSCSFSVSGTLSLPQKTRWWYQIIFYFYPYVGKWSNLTNMCQMGWNHPQMCSQMRVHMHPERYTHILHCILVVWSWFLTAKPKTSESPEKKVLDLIASPASTSGRCLTGNFRF